MRYNNYHKHTHYSNPMTPDSITKPIDYIKRACELGHTSYFTTEHGYQGDIFEAYTLCQQHGLKCIYAVEAYYVNNMYEKDNSNNHIMLIAMTESGRKQINKIISKAMTEGFYYKPRIDLECLLYLNPDDVVITTACVASPLFKGDNWKENFFIPVWEHFKSSFYLEVQSHNDDNQINYNFDILKLKKEYGCKLIHGNDSHYIYPQDSIYRDKFVKAKGITYEDEGGFVLDYPSCEIIMGRYKSQGVLSQKEVNEAISNTCIFDNAEGIKLDKEFKIPTIKQDIMKRELQFGDSFQYDNNDKVLKKIISDAWQKEKNKVDPNRIEEYKAAIKDEVKTIEQCYMQNYFILDHMIVKRAVNEYHGIITRSGRGSAVSNYTNKLLGLTEVDRIAAPIVLYPSRFMSAERILNSKSCPDIDLNFANVEPVIKASKDILGEDNIYYMVAFKPLQEASAFRLWCKSEGYNITEYDEIAKNIDDYKDDVKWGQIIKDSERFIGVIESIAPHPCSFLLLDKPISEEIGLIKIKDETCCLITSYYSDVYKYLKNDYLIVTVYKIISQVYEMLGRPIDDIKTLLEKCDDKVWDIYANALTTSINQADSAFAKSTLKRYKPKSLAELSAWVAAIRPGFASLLNNFLDRKPYTTGVKQLDDLLEDSFHYLMYQESIMKYLVWLGIEEKETYDIVKKIAKKKFKENELKELKSKLKEQWKLKVGTDDGFDSTWQVIEDASRYSFNACLSGDTIIQRGSSNGRWRPTIEEMYKVKNDIEYAKATGHLDLHSKYKSKGYCTALSMFKDNRIRKNTIIDIYYSGIENIYRVKTKNGAYIDCTMNHRFPTPNGIKFLKELSVGDCLYVKSEYEVNRGNYNFTNGTFKKNTPVIGQMGFQKNPDGNSVKFYKEKERCQTNHLPCSVCGEKYDESKRFELHHMDFDRTHNDSDNLEWLCCSCHKKIHYKHGRVKVYEKGIPTILSEIESIEFLRKDKVYDVEMAEPAHTIVSETGLVASNSHSLSVGIDSLYGAYLKSHYPLEYYTVVLNLYADDTERTKELISELSYFGIKLKSIKFGKSLSNHVPDKATNSIYKGIAAIKYCNDTIAEELMTVYQNVKGKHFIEVLDEISKTSINSKQLNILIGLNFFSDYGKNKKLMAFTDIYNGIKSGSKTILPCIRECKKLSKDKLDLYERFGMTETLIKRYSEKETEKSYTGIDNVGLLKELFDKIPDREMNLTQRINFEKEYLGCIEFKNPKVPDTYYIVTEFKTYKDPCKPYVTLRRICDGEEMKTKVKYAPIFRSNPFALDSILKVNGFTWEYKKKKVNDKWVTLDEREPILEKYERIR